MPPLFPHPADHQFAVAVSQLMYANPFLTERIDLEHQALGHDFADVRPVWSLEAGEAFERPNLRLLHDRSESLVQPIAQQLAAGSSAKEADLRLYEDLAIYCLFERYRVRLRELTLRAAPTDRRTTVPAPFWPAFDADFNTLLHPAGRTLPSDHQSAHLFAYFWQVQRAFTHIFHFLVGGSMPLARLRADIWQSLFTRDMRRHYRLLHARMAEITTLIVGPTGTGKELVARAIGQSNYIPFDPRRRAFAAHPASLFFPLNLSALSPTLIESELFGHKRGAFTGAVADRQGWLAACPQHGSVFLDEIGELDPAIQVKLLRVLQSRTFEPLGSTDTHRFDGKIIAATHRDLPAEMHAGRFRTDFFYRLCSDVITMPTLRQQLDADPADRPRLLRFIAERLVGPEAAPALADEVHQWIQSNLPDNYPWPGNVRELEQCLRNVLVRGNYAPPRTLDAQPHAIPDLCRDDQGDFVDVQTLLDRYCAMVHEREGNFQAAARRLGLDRRTVANHVRRAAEAGDRHRSNP